MKNIENKNEVIWLYIGRLNPAHKGHLEVIKKAISENVNNILFLWSPIEKEPEKNPLDFEQRKNILRKIFKEENLKIFEIVDDQSNLAWILKIYRKIFMTFPDAKELNFYYGSDEDSAFNVLKEYEEFFAHKINYIKIDREQTFIEYNLQKLELSATNFRKYLRNWQDEIAKNFTDERIFTEIKKYFKSN